MELFAKAVKVGLVFNTERGTLTPQDVYQLPLTGNNSFNLDVLSRSVLKKVRASEEESLVLPVKKIDTLDELRLEILTYIIKDKQEELEASKNAVEIKQQREQLLRLKARKQEQLQDELSMEDIDKQLSELK